MENNRYIISKICTRIGAVLVILFILYFAYPDKQLSEGVSKNITLDKGDELILLSIDETIEMKYKVMETRGDIYSIRMTLKNVLGDCIQDWGICMNYTDEIVEIKGALYEKIGNENVEIINSGTDKDLDKNKSITLEIISKMTGEVPCVPKYFYSSTISVQVDKKDLTVKKRINKIKKGFNVKISITNKKNRKIYAWRLDIYSNNKVSRVINVKNANMMDLYNKKCIQLCSDANNNTIGSKKTISLSFVVKAKKFSIKRILVYEMIDNKVDTSKYDQDVEYSESDEYDLDSINLRQEESIQLSNNKKGRAIKAITPLIDKTISLKKNNTDRFHAIQNYCIDGENIKTLYKQKKYGTQVACFTKESSQKNGTVTLNQSNAIIMNGFAHGQSLECIDYNIKEEKKRLYMMCSGATSDGWARNVVFIDKAEFDNRGDTFVNTDVICKKVIGIGGTTKLRNEPYRLDSAISNDMKHMVIWFSDAKRRKNKDGKRYLIILNLSRVLYHLYDEGETYINLLSEKVKEDVVELVVESTEKILQPNDSFQSIDIGNSYNKGNKWDVYITSGNEVNDQPITITKYTLQRKKATAFKDGRIIKARRFKVNSPKINGKRVISGDCELEGGHLSGKYFKFIIVKSTPKDSAEAELYNYEKQTQFIVKIKKSIFNSGTIIV